MSRSQVRILPGALPGYAVGHSQGLLWVAPKTVVRPPSFSRHCSSGQPGRSDRSLAPRNLFTAVRVPRAW
jgi:hypothetical protein